MGVGPAGPQPHSWVTHNEAFAAGFIWSPFRLWLDPVPLSSMGCLGLNSVTCQVGPLHLCILFCPLTPPSRWGRAFTKDKSQLSPRVCLFAPLPLWESSNAKAAPIACWCPRGRAGSSRQPQWQPLPQASAPFLPQSQAPSFGSQ